MWASPFDICAPVCAPHWTYVRMHAPYGCSYFAPCAMSPGGGCDTAAWPVCALINDMRFNSRLAGRAICKLCDNPAAGCAAGDSISGAWSAGNDTGVLAGVSFDDPTQVPRYARDL